MTDVNPKTARTVRQDAIFLAESIKEDGRLADDRLQHEIRCCSSGRFSGDGQNAGIDIAIEKEACVTR